MAIRSVVGVILALLLLPMPAHAKRSAADSRQVMPQEMRRAPIRILSPVATKRGIRVQVRIPAGTPDGNGRARLWTANMGMLLGTRHFIVLNGMRVRRMWLPLNRQGRRLLRRGRIIVRARAMVPAPTS